MPVAPIRSLTMLAVALVVSGGAGLLAGGAGVPSAEEAARVQSRSAAVAALSRDTRPAYERGLRRGKPAGAKQGEERGRTTGAALGARAGKLAVGDRDVAAMAIAAARGNGRTLPGAGGVLFVGDSLGKLTSPYLERYLPSVPITVNAVGGYSSLQLFELFRQSFRPSHSVIVFDAGTNDNPSYPMILAGRLRAVAKIAGGRCLVIPTIHGLTVDGVDSTGKQQAVRAFAASRPGVQVPDWAGFMAKHRELMQSDNLHPTAAGADARARLIAGAVRRCLGDRR